MSVFQADFWKDYIVVLVTTIILGAGAAAGIAGALDVAFGQAVSGLLGEAGEYDLIVHVREQSASVAAVELEERLTARHGGIVVRQGVTVAGNANFFVKLPDSMREQAVLEQLASSIGDLPGFNGYSWIIEPSVTVTGLRPGMRDLLALEAASISGVRAAIRHGTSITVLLDSADHQRDVVEALQNRLDGRQIMEIRLPQDSNAHREQVVRAVIDKLQPRTLRDVTARSGQADSPLDELADGLQDYLPLWRRLVTASSTAAEAANKLVEFIDMLEPALALAEGPEQQGERLSAAVRSGDGVGAIRQALLSVIAANLFQTLTGQAAASPAEQPPAEPSPDAEAQSSPSGPTGLPSRADLHRLRAGLTTLAEDASALQRIAEDDLLASFEAVERLLPAALYDAGVLELFIDAHVSPEDVQWAVREATGEEVAVFASTAGIVNPNPRAIVMELLVDVRRTIAGLLAILTAVGSLVLDHATVFTAMAHFPGSRRQRPWVAAGVGAVLVGAIYALSGGGIPLIGPWTAAAIGALLGLLIMVVAGRLSPVNADEILAGQALGLDDGQIMREIVVPAGRPGLMTFFNGRRREFL